ncbi:hypothetical protein FNF29_06342 [Cafeteria roenbergensis]|uniref:Large ribosomal subunit protein eL14 domain-containing protein n=1 Tax=Cafeteria roenbergensis TaxID=33653 RepID=A0A5A8C7S0_CAFRO|nr:hypothetical protein FNF29_06342 [Cafeteria roenbergensis]|eukprot:KAA0148868.1 hypothetical protein FNF29_06342 [Cafeteria roenbergensis]
MGPAPARNASTSASRALHNASKLTASPVPSAKMTAFRRFVQVGRVVLVNYGPDEGKLAVIVDVVDQSRVMIDGPSDDASAAVRRQVINLRRVSLTDFALKLARGARAKTVKAAWAKEDVSAKWAASSWGQKLAAQAAKRAMSDKDRFVAMLARKAAAKKVRAALGK